MAKLTLNNITSGYASATATNSNNDLIEDAVENTLSRDGTSPNQMLSNLDMNNYTLLNCAALDVDSLSINGTLVVPTGVAAAEIPSQGGHVNKFLQTNGTVVSWQIPDAVEIANAPSGGIAATTVQAAINELDTEKANLTGATFTGPVTVTNTSASNSFVVEDSANPDATPFVIDASGRVIIGHTASVTGSGGVVSSVQNIATTASAGLFALRNSVTGAARSVIETAKSASATAGAHTLVSNGEYLGVLRFSGSDGTNFIRAVDIEAFVDGTPGTNNMPGRLVFSTTPNGSNTPIEAMRISQDQSVLCAGNISAANLLSGTFTPTLTNTTNVAASTAYLCNYMRVGSVVTVSGRVDIDTTAAATTLTELDMTVPINSAFSVPTQGAGTASTSGTSANGSASVFAISGNTVRITFYAGDTANRSWAFHYTYRII